MFINDKYMSKYHYLLLYLVPNNIIGEFLIIHKKLIWNNEKVHNKGTELFFKITLRLDGGFR